MQSDRPAAPSGILPHRPILHCQRLLVVGGNPGVHARSKHFADVLKQRAKQLRPLIQRCDALSRNVPKLAEEIKILVANCLADGRRQFVEVA